MSSPPRAAGLHPRTPVLAGVGQVSERLGQPGYQHGHADLRERDLMSRADLSAGPASVLAAQHALDVAGIGVGDLRTIDLYSCFPVPVFNVCEGLGLAFDDPRGLTVTGGLPFFGGPGNNYSMHAVAAPEPVGERVYVRSSEAGNQVTVS